MDYIQRRHCFSILGFIFLLVLSRENVASTSFVSRSEESISASNVPLGLWKRETKPPGGTDDGHKKPPGGTEDDHKKPPGGKEEENHKPKVDDKKPPGGKNDGGVPACAGAPKGVFSLLPSALKLPNNAGITCHNASTEHKIDKREEHPPVPGKGDPHGKGDPADHGKGAEKMDSKDCVCAFNLLQQYLYSKNGKPDPKETAKKGPFTYKWKNGAAFGKACPLPPTEKVEKCDPKKKGSCALVPSKLKGCATVKSCTVKITTTGKSDLSSLPVQTALTDLHYGFQSYAWSCCPLNGFDLAINDFPGAKETTDSFEVEGGPSSTTKCEA
ncbi:hypothetical protein DFH28DRAFT_1227506 [Melampsora americana]|nr:hypothetical protein DFH28DRAFT_1227506 [Melampsora americana]